MGGGGGCRWVGGGVDLWVERWRCGCGVVWRIQAGCWWEPRGGRGRGPGCGGGAGGGGGGGGGGG
ncbi:hypothetical protein, partial [Lacticaseibacillus rhamnosus]|uniref:hypothetical protein n=1 Tax=Lacticaseibacillus rhamnosus TaxID=47715 RepID=UPI001CDD2082